MSRSTFPHHVDTAIIGGGQAGLTMGYYLAQQNRSFVILDAGSRVGDVWRHRWDSLRVFSSARNSTLPGRAFSAPDSSFPTKDEMGDYLEAYADQFDLPVCLDTRVESLTRSDDHYELTASSQRFTANHVVLATGPFHRPNVPPFAEELGPAITQLHSSAYKTPDQLPNGDILVVGAGNSGAEIAVELANTGRRVYLSGRKTGSIPHGLFNSRVFWWLFGRVLTVDTRGGRKLKTRRQGRGDPLIRLTNHDVQRAGVERVPRTDCIVDGKPQLEDGRILDVAAVVWAIGFRPDFSWVDLPGLTMSEDGYPIHYRGVIEGVPGLYLLGVPFQSSLLSATIHGVGIDAQYIAGHLPTVEDSEHSSFQVEDQSSTPIEQQRSLTPTAPPSGR